MRRGGDRRDSRIGLSSYSRGQKISNRQWPGHKYSMYTALPEGNGKPQGVTFAKKPKYEVKTKKISHSTSGGTSESRGAAECIGEEQIADLSKTHVDDDRTLDSTGKEKECMKLKKNLDIATWNVRSMSSGKLDNIVEEAVRTGVDILGIAEHRWPGQGHFRPSAGGLMVYAGRTRGGQGGVGLYINQKAN